MYHGIEKVHTDASNRWSLLFVSLSLAQRSLFVIFRFKRVFDRLLPLGDKQNNKR
jgi:hypothetical protein